MEIRKKKLKPKISSSMNRELYIYNTTEVITFLLKVEYNII